LYEINITQVASTNIIISNKIFYVTQMLFSMRFYIMRPPLEFEALVELGVIKGMIIFYTNYS